MQQRREIVGDLEVAWREAPSAPVVYVHGVPTDGADWLPFLERGGGYAPDLPGFGTSDKPAHFDYSIAGYSRFLSEFADTVGLDRFSLVMHDWGAAALPLAQASPERIERLVLIDALPLLPGYRWHRFARIWRTPLAGELFMGFSSKWALRRLVRWTVPPREPPPELIDRVWSHFDHGTQRAILKLYRGAPPPLLAAAGTGLQRIGAPALVVWGAHDPYLPASLARQYADALGGAAEVEVLPDAGHWPWLDDPQVVDRVVAFLRSG